MLEFKFPAVEVRQGALKFYTTSIPVKQLLSDGFYNVERLDPKSGKGFQRVLEKPRTKKIADYILDNIDHPGGVFIPTSIFLTTEKDVKFDADTRNLAIDPSVLPFNVVDGQHRLEGFKMAIQKERRVLDMQIAVNICPNMPLLHQMCYFYIVNTTQIQVDESVKNKIISLLTEEYKFGKFPGLPKWMQRIIELGETDLAVKIVEYLNSEKDSPWYGKIIMAGESRRDGRTIKFSSFVKAVQRNFVTDANPVSIEFADNRKDLYRAIKNYWRGIANCIEPDENSVFYKTNGLETFCKLSPVFMMKLQEKGDYSVDAVEQLFSHLSQNIEANYTGVVHADYWRVGGPMSGLNAEGKRPIIVALTRAVHATAEAREVKL